MAIPLISKAAGLCGTNFLEPALQRVGRIFGRGGKKVAGSTGQSQAHAGCVRLQPSAELRTVQAGRHMSRAGKCPPLCCRKEDGAVCQQKEPHRRRQRQGLFEADRARQIHQTRSRFSDLPKGSGAMRLAVSCACRTLFAATRHRRTGCTARRSCVGVARYVRAAGCLVFGGVAAPGRLPLPVHTPGKCCPAYKAGNFYEASGRGQAAAAPARAAQKKPLWTGYVEISC